MNLEIINYLISRGANRENIQQLIMDLAQIKSTKKNIFDVDFQKQILFNSTFLNSEQLCILVREMNRGDAVMVERILNEGRDKTFTPEEIVEALDFKDPDKTNELYNQALQLILQKQVYSQVQNRLNETE